MQKKALIIGSEGQDGQLLAKLLYERNYKIYAIINKTKLKKNNYGIKKFKINILDKEKITNFFKKIFFNEIYFLPITNINPEEKVNRIVDNNNFSINTIGLVNILENLIAHKSSKFFYASSSYIFESTKQKISEKNTYAPQNFYGLCKLSGMEICNYYRNKYSLFCTVGILFSHTSHLAGDRYLINRIVNELTKQKNKKKISIHVGNPNQKIQILAALDASEAIFNIMQLSKADCFIISGLKTVTIEKLVFEIAAILVPTANIRVIGRKKILKNSNTNSSLLGNSAKLRKKCKWSEKVRFEDLIYQIHKHYDVS